MSKEELDLIDTFDTPQVKVEVKPAGATGAAVDEVTTGLETTKVIDLNTLYIIQQPNRSYQVVDKTDYAYQVKKDNNGCWRYNAPTQSGGGKTKKRRNTKRQRRAGFKSRAKRS